MYLSYSSGSGLDDTDHFLPVSDGTARVSGIHGVVMRNVRHGHMENTWHIWSWSRTVYLPTHLCRLNRRSSQRAKFALEMSRLLGPLVLERY
jgi:hypothetical protein